jgi:penicillin amidase
MRLVKRLFLGLLLALLLIVIGGWLWLLTSLPKTDGIHAINGLRKAVEIRRDRNGVPHIKAQTEHDSYVALGYVHAQDRLWQMDFLRRLGAGRLSEVLGEATVQSDRYMRTLGLYRLAQTSLARLPPDARAAIDAYTKGVNAYLDSRKGAWPIEFYMLRYRPERWKPADSLVWGRIMGIFLSRNWREETLRAHIKRTLGADALPILFPDYPADGPRTLAAYGDGEDNPIAVGSASNAWVVSGDRTITKKPLLANDPHLRFRTPALWYLATVDWPGGSLAGATVPGVPFMVLGRNSHIAWGFTSAETDVQDLYLEKLDATRHGWYSTPEGARRFAERTEIIRVRDQPDVMLAVRSTRHGPVISDLSPGVKSLAPKGHVLALATPALREDDDSALASYKLNHARNWKQFRAAVRSWHAPPLNIAYADKDGNIGLITAARVPLRNAGDGRLPAEGWSGEFDWVGWIPFDDLPQYFNPPGGMIANANNPTVTAGYPYNLGRWRTPGYRARRLEQLLKSRRSSDVAAMTRIQNDSVSVAARDLLAMLLQTEPRTEKAGRVHAMMRGWDGTMARDIPQPLIFIAWLRALNRRLLADELAELYDHYGGLHPQTIKTILQREISWCDDKSTPIKESCNDQVAASLDDAMIELSERFGPDFTRWQWGEAHITRFDHPVLGRLPVIGGLFNVRLPADGGPYTLNRGMVRTSSDAPYASVHGAGYRAVYDLANVDQSRFIVSPGQSGNWFSSHYDDLAERWRNGGWLLLKTPSQDADVLTLEPKNRHKF